MKKGILIFIALAFGTIAQARCIGKVPVIGTGSTRAECAEAYELKQQQKQLALERKKQQLKAQRQELTGGSQNQNQGTIVNVNSGGGMTPEEQAGHEAAPLQNEAMLAIYISSALFELSPQQPGAGRQFLTGQNSGGTAIGGYYRFAKGVHLVGQYERFRYKGKVFSRRDPSSGNVQQIDQFGNPVYDPDTGEAVMEEVTMRDNSYQWADEYLHTRYMFGIGFRGIISEEQKLTWALDIFPVGWYETEFVHSDERPNEVHSASKSYGFRGNINYHVSPDFWISGYYQLFDAQKEAADFVDEYRPLGSQEFGVTMAFGLPNVLGLVP